MSWAPPTVPVARFYQAGRLLAAAASVNAVAEAVGRQATTAPEIIPQKYGYPLSRTVTRTKMKYPRRPAAKVSKAISKYVKKAITQAREVKAKSSGPSTSMLHANIYSCNITANVVEGPSDDERIGDTIHPKSLVLNYSFIAPATAGAYAYRIIVFYSGNEYSSTSLATGASGFTFAELFQPTTSADSIFMAVPNPKAITILGDQLININSNITATKDIHSGRMNIRLGTSAFKYESLGSIFGKTKNLYIAVTSYVADGVTNETATGIAVVNYDFRYADS